jgi:hypothetical protein
MKEEKPYYSRKAYDYILRFIRARHFGDIEESTRCQKWLKKHFGTIYSKALLYHGDPDDNNYQNYDNVMAAWWEESMRADK